MALSLKVSIMIFDSVIIPGGISSTGGARIYAQPVKFQENHVLHIFFKTWYRRNLKLGMMRKITQLWPLSPLLPLLCQFLHQD